MRVAFEDGVIPKRLEPIPVGQECDALLRGIWNAVQAAQTDALRHMIAQMYYAVLRHYVRTQYASTVGTLAQQFNKQLSRHMRAAGLDGVRMRDFLNAAQAAGLPFDVHEGPRGGGTVLPRGVTAAYSAAMRAGLNEGIEVSLPELADVLMGKAPGPVLEGQALERAQRPF